MRNFITLLIVVFLALIGIGYMQLRLQDIADAKCVKTSSAPEFWHFECPDGRAFYMEKTETEKRKYGAYL